MTNGAKFNPAGKDRVILDAPKLDDLAFQEGSHFYDVMPDGEHFVMVMSPRHAPVTHYNVIVNWFEEVTRKASKP